MASLANESTGAPEAPPGAISDMYFGDDVTLETKNPTQLINTFKGITGRKKLQRRRALSKEDIELMTEVNYLENVILKFEDNSEEQLNAVPEIRNQILTPDIMNLTDAEEQIEETIDLVTGKKETKIQEGKAQWIYCEKNCVKALSSQIKKEIHSTAFMLRVLSNSIIDTTANDNGENGQLPLKFLYVNPNREKLTGKWDNDQKFFKLIQLDPQTERSRLIMGLGPSAAGKTFWARNVIKLMTRANNNFPRSFLSVDGGLVRELSYIYQDIIRALAKHPRINGFNNLVSSGWDPFHKSLFSAGKVKKSIQEYLKTQKTNNELPVSIYVPETLGSPAGSGFKSKVEKYVKITGDNNWIGLYIWQGRTPQEDQKWVNKFKQKNQNIGNENIDALSTTVSGKGRELTEGKKYSSSAYNYSKKHGYQALKKAPGARIDIHNSGGKKTNGVFNKSVVIEYPNAQGQYLLNQEMLDDFNSIYLQKPIELLGQIGGRKTRRRLRHKSRKTKRRRKNRRRKTKRRRKRKSRKR